MIKYLLVTLILLSSFRTNLFSKVISVPKDYKKIQLALDASMDGDTILVSKGVYKENIDFYGKKVMLTSKYTHSGNKRFIKKTVIKGQGDDPAVTFSSNEDSSSSVIGFTITGGEGSLGGGIFCSMANPILKDLIIKENESQKGGGIGLYSSSPVIKDVKIISNTALSSGALFITGYSSPKISNVLLANNKTYVNGGSITVEEYSNPVFTNVTISDNGYPDKVHPMIIQYFGEMNPTMVNGIHISNGSNVFIKSSIIYSEADLEVLFGEYGEGSSLTISYSNLDGGKSSIIDKYNSGTLNWNEGNIVSDPKFVNPKKNNYSLKNSSPSINKGDPNGIIKNMGASLVWD